MTFKRWLRVDLCKRIGTDQFTEDIFADKTFPRSKDFAIVLKYLIEEKHIDDRRSREFKDLWKQYIDYTLSDIVD